jgi:murein L,D-transpeptidase YcbB/YkuD
METGIKGLQAEAGIKGDGVIGDGTIAALNTILTDHAQQIALNMERRRWLSRDVPDTRIDVNTAAALLDYYKDGKAVWS